jgi:hypothetical protein
MVKQIHKGKIMFLIYLSKVDMIHKNLRDLTESGIDQKIAIESRNP